MKIKTALISIIILLSVACQQQENKTKPDPLAINIDTTVAPGEDFFQYASGAWLRDHPIPEEESHWGIGNVVQNEIYLRLKAVNEDAVKKKFNGCRKEDCQFLDCRNGYC